MGGVLDEFPLDFSKPELRELRDLLAQVIYRLNDIEEVVLAAGLNPGLIDFSGNAAMQWRSILVQARGHDRLPALLSTVTTLQPPLRVRIDELLAPQPILAPAPPTADGPTGPGGAGWKGFGAERLVVAGTDTLLGVVFLSVGVEMSRSVCRLTSTFDGKSVFGTGSLIGPRLLLTNHHVLHDWDEGGAPAVAVEAWFDYELDAAGTTRQMTVVPCDATTIAGDREHDWAIVQLASAPPQTSAVLELGRAEAPRKDDYVFIIQHPEGGPKMIGLSHNLVRHVDDDVVQYWTDTKAGSSGAPVFNAKWQVVGLHHRWVESPEDDGMAYRNQGRRIERVVDGLRSRRITFGGDRGIT
jgi:V8-like Glu-specific endopeptidase